MSTNRKRILSRQPKYRKLVIVTGMAAFLFAAGSFAANANTQAQAQEQVQEQVEENHVYSETGNYFAEQYEILYESEADPELVDRVVKKLAEQVRANMEAEGSTKSIYNYVSDSCLVISDYMDYNDKALDKNRNVKPGYDDTLTGMINRSKLPWSRTPKGTCSQYTRLLCRVLAELGIDSEYCGGMVNAEPAQIEEMLKKMREEAEKDEKKITTKMKHLIDTLMTQEPYVPVEITIDDVPSRWKHAWVRIDLNQGTGKEPEWKYVDPTRFDSKRRQKYIQMEENDYFNTWYEMNVFE